MKEPVSTPEAELVKANSIPPELVAIGGAVQALFQNLGEAQIAQAESQAKAQIAQADSQFKQAEVQARAKMHAEEEATKRQHLAMGAIRPLFWCVFALYGFVAIIAAVAMVQGQKDLTEKLVIALLSSLFSLLAGMGLTRKQ